MSSAHGEQQRLTMGDDAKLTYRPGLCNGGGQPGSFELLNANVSHTHTGPSLPARASFLARTFQCVEFKVQNIINTVRRILEEDESQVQLGV